MLIKLLELKGLTHKLELDWSYPSIFRNNREWLV